jgi:hypothetical protein
LMFNVNVTLTFDLKTPKTIGVIFWSLTIPNLHTKFKVPRPKHFLINDLKPFGLRTNRSTDRQMQSNKIKVSPIINNKNCRRTVTLDYSKICHKGVSLSIIMLTYMNT